MTIDEAVRHLRCDPRHAKLMRDSYLGEDAPACAQRFLDSAEFQETLRLLGQKSKGIVLDLGAGTGIASYAFARSGAQRVYAVEPDASDVVGRGAISRVTNGLPVEIVAAHGEGIPLPDRSVDVVYARQVLHHASDLRQLLRDCARVLKSGGAFLACREHVVDDDSQLQRFLRHHPMHQLVGGEHAYSLNAYVDAIRDAGLHADRIMGQWDTVINAFPSVNSNEELNRYPQILLERRLGPLGSGLARIDCVRKLVWKRLNRPVPGRLFAFLAQKT